MMLTPALRGHRASGVALFGLPVLLFGASLPTILRDASATSIPALDGSAAAGVLGASAGPVVLLMGTTLLVGAVLDLAATLRLRLSVATVGAIASVLGGLTLALVAAAGAVAAGTLSGTAARVGFLVVALGAAALLVLGRGLLGLARSGEVSRTGGILTVLATAGVLVGALTSPAGTLVTASALMVLLALSAVLGAVTGLCAAAAVVRRPRRARPYIGLLRLARPERAHS